MIAIISRNHVLIRLLPSPQRMEFSEATGLGTRKSFKQVLMSLAIATELPGKAAELAFFLEQWKSPYIARNRFGYERVKLVSCL